MSFSFTKKYIFALSIIALFSVIAYLYLTDNISSRANDAEMINLTGKQRMLSQRIALYAMSHEYEKLEYTVYLMEEIHKYLISINMSNNIKKIYFDEPTLLDYNVKKYISSARSFIKNKDSESLNYILKNSESLSENQDIIVLEYQNNAEEKIQDLLVTELYIVSFIMLTLVFEAFFIFRPINNSIMKKTQELLYEKEYSDMITQINTNAIIVVDNNLEVLTFNKSAEYIFGFSEKEMLHTKLIDDRIIPIKYLKAHYDGLVEFMKYGELKNKDAVFELEGKRKDKTTFPIRISFGIRIEKEKKIVVANIQDISKEKDKDALIVQQSRFAAMGEMIGNIAHQWRQPLSAISAISSGTKIKYQNNLIGDEELEKSFDKIKDYTLHLSKTIDDFRGFLSHDREIELFKVRELIDKLKNLVDAMYTDNNIKLHIDIKDDDIEINGSSSELSQVYLNILHNAKDILIENNIQDKNVLIKVQREEKNILISVYDNAGGIPENIKLKIFEPYFTTKHKSQGTGIGLFMSKRIIEQHYHGSLRAKNDNFFIDDKKYFGASFNVRIKLS